MEILTGKHRGKKARLHQFENDWMTADVLNDDGTRVVAPGQVVSPRAVKLTTPEEFARFASGTSAGQFFKLWKLREDGTFLALRNARTS